MRAALSRIPRVLAIAAPLVPLPVLACSITLQTPGSLRASIDNTTLGSEVNGTTPATLTSVLSILDGTVSIDVSAPTRIQSPASYNAAAEVVQVAYDAPAVLGFGGASQGYTSSTTSFQAGLLGAVTFSITLHNRITNPNGFAPGIYTTRTVVTCHP